MITRLKLRFAMFLKRNFFFFNKKNVSSEEFPYHAHNKKKKQRRNDNLRQAWETILWYKFYDQSRNLTKIIHLNDRNSLVTKAWNQTFT